MVQRPFKTYITDEWLKSAEVLKSSFGEVNLLIEDLLKKIKDYIPNDKYHKYMNIDKDFYKYINAILLLSFIKGIDLLSFFDMDGNDISEMEFEIRKITQDVVMKKSKGLVRCDLCGGTGILQGHDDIDPEELHNFTCDKCKGEGFIKIDKGNDHGK